MKCKIFVDKNKDEEVLIYTHEINGHVEEIKRVVTQEIELVGYKNEEIKKIDLSDVTCFIIEDGKTYAYLKNDKFLIKLRLFQIEEIINESFVKINQSCIANIRKIKKFEATLGGSLLVKFNNGYSDYISRRQLKKVKERIGL